MTLEQEMPMGSLGSEILAANAIMKAAEKIIAKMPPRQAPDELLTVKDVAGILHVSLNYANMLVQSGIIPALRLNGMKVRRRTLETWMASMEGMDLSDPADPMPLRRAKEA